MHCEHDWASFMYTYICRMTELKRGWSCADAPLEAAILCTWSFQLTSAKCCTSYERFKLRDRWSAKDLAKLPSLSTLGIWGLKPGKFLQWPKMHGRKTKSADRRIDEMMKMLQKLTAETKEKHPDFIAGNMAGSLPFAWALLGSGGSHFLANPWRHRLGWKCPTQSGVKNYTNE